MENIYGACGEHLNEVLGYLLSRVQQYCREYEDATGEKLYEHFCFRVKTEESMREKCIRRGYEPSAHSALRCMYDAVGLRIVCLFIDDIYENIRRIRALDRVRIVEEKDYIRRAKPNGYRSYHLIVDVETPFEDVDGNVPGHYFAEIQLRTIAMDTWAALEHELKYKKTIEEPELIAEELRRCANDLAACDVSMQTLRTLIRSY